ncbi:STT3 domain-containing protein [Methanobacterium alcaliphilum]|uniref:STT3 domain-containing protein n=1 Tax=Methanobacterium alcaliphilum TaxID=392018 RepID=UPI00200AE86B|nr:STT3 domain-containing protein [Methanobacterium alcaliphilum]MCK9152445.1 dolichyl-diphosphooligosaccharide--protein glycosyltransferase subunit STT3 [Methanobacterium alcaliphilum]
MNSKEILSKLKPLIIIILLFSVVFFLRAEAYNISGVPNDTQSFYKDASGLPYFSEMDSYYNYRLTLNYIENGMMGDTKINGSDWDLHSYFPPGRAVDYPPLIVYITTFFYYIANLVGEVPLMVVAYWTGAIIGSLCVIPAYLFVRKITNDYGGVAAGILVATAPTYFAHTYAGFFDTDMFNILLPLLVIWFFVESIQANNTKTQVFFAVLSALSLLIFSMAWVGYIFYLVMLILFVVVYILIAQYVLKLDVIKSPKTYPNLMQWFINQKEVFSLSVILILGFIFIGIFNGFSSIGSSITGLFGATQIQELVQTTAYPNVYISVSELQIPTLISTTNGISSVMLPGQTSVVGGVGGLIAFLAGIAGIGILIWKMNILSTNKSKKIGKKLPKSERRKKEKTKVKGAESKANSIKNESSILGKAQAFQLKRDHLLYVVLFSVWLLLTGYAVTKGFRFVSTFSVPISLSAGIFVGFAVVYVRENLKTGSTLALLAFITAALTIYPFGISTIITLGIGILAALLVILVKKPKVQSYAVMILVLLAVISPSLAAANSLANSVVPGTDDAMYNSMQWVKANSTNETVVISWWDFGHFFTATADRPVTFDGGSQNTPRAYWVGKAMLTNNESLSAGIFRMLASSGDKAYLTLDNYTTNSGRSAEILNETLGLSKDTAKSVMTSRYNLTNQQADTVLNYTHPDNPRPYVFVASSDLLGKAGWWSYFGNWDFEKGNSSGYNYYPAVASSKPQTINNTNISQTVNTMVGDQIVGVIVNETTNGTNATIVVGEVNGTSYQSIAPHKVFIVNGNQIVKNEIVDSNSTLSLIAIGEKGQYTTILMDKELEDSMFTKLFLMGGFNQTTFQPAHQEQGILLWTPISNTTSSTGTSPQG